MVTFRDIQFRSLQGVDADQSAFSVNYAVSPSLAGWRFERCSFVSFWKCFDVTGDGMCSEFSFWACQFSQCYHLLHNDNVQAVNWNFYGCHWENPELSTAKDEKLAAAFLIKKGTKVNWYGGSAIFWGRLVLYNLTVAGSFQRVAHSIHFDGLRFELVDEGGSHVPIIDRIDAGYVTGTNQPVTTLNNIDVIKLGSIGISNDIAIARAWNNCILVISNSNPQICHVEGVLDAATPTATASVTIDNCDLIGYVENTAARALSHHQHRVTINPANPSSGTALQRDTRLCDLGTAVGSNLPAAKWSTVNGKILSARGSTGSLPQGGQTVDLPNFPDHTVIMKMFVQRFMNAANPLTVEFRDKADTTTYASAVLAAGTDRLAEANVGLEVGYQIPSGTALMLKFVGTANPNIKGVFGLVLL